MGDIIFNPDQKEFIPTRHFEQENKNKKKQTALLVLAIVLIVSSLVIFIYALNQNKLPDLPKDVDSTGL